MIDYVHLADCVNGTFELGGAYFVGLSVQRVLHDRQVRGVDWRTTAFWTLWGAWNVFYYPHLDQWASFAGGVAVLTMNTLYLALLLHYHRAEQRKALLAWRVAAGAAAVHVEGGRPGDER